MPTDTEIWDAACERVGLRKHVDMIRREDDDGYGIERPALAIGGPAAVVAMLEWLLRSHLISIWLNDYYQYWIIELLAGGTNQRIVGDTLPLALAAAVNTVPQEI